MNPSTPFLTDLDPRSAIKGSRDALGSQAVWASVGRRLVGNLTLTSRDAANFRTLLIGYGLPRSDVSDEERVRVFLRWEQAAAACREAAGDKVPPLGALRVRRELAKSARFTLSEEPEHQILRDQRASGLWVLYHRAAKISGLVDDRRRLTAVGRSLAEPWIAQLRSIGSMIDRVLAYGPKKITVAAAGQPSDEAAAVVPLLRMGSSKADRRVLAKHLVYGDLSDETGLRFLAQGQQQRLAALLVASHERDSSFRTLVPALQTDARTGNHKDLADRLEEIVIAESVLHPAQAAFDALLHDAHGADLDDFAQRIGKSWPGVASHVRAGDFRDRVAGTIRSAVGDPRTHLWTSAADAMAAGQWPNALETLVEINGDTMRSRGGAAWARINERRIVDVRLRGESGLPDEADIAAGWNNPYYLTPLVSLCADLVGRPR